MAPRSRKKASVQLLYVPFLKIPFFARRTFMFRRRKNLSPGVRTLYELRDELRRMGMKEDYDSSVLPIVRWEQDPPFGGGVLRGTRSDQDYKDSWECFCGEENGPLKRRLFDIPAPMCRKCSRKATVDFDFMYGRTMLNGFNTIRTVRSQARGECCATAWTAAAEIDQTIMLALNGEVNQNLCEERPLHFLDDGDLVTKRMKYRRRIIRANNELKKFNIDVGLVHHSTEEVAVVGAIAKVCGIRSKPMHGIHKIAGSKMLDKNDFAEICAAVADGPVVATFDAGIRLDDLAFGEVYKAPGWEKYLREDAEEIGHVVVLVGAGRNAGREYFYFLNSWGEEFCCRFTHNGVLVPGGIGIIRASDISTDPIHLRREVPKDG